MEQICIGDWLIHHEDMGKRAYVSLERVPPRGEMYSVLRYTIRPDSESCPVELTLDLTAGNVVPDEVMVRLNCILLVYGVDVPQ